MKSYINLVLVFCLIIATSCTKMESLKEKAAKDFVSEVQTKLAKAYNATTLAYYNASISGRDADWKTYQSLDMAMNDVLSNKAYFDKLKNFNGDSEIQNDTLKRTILVLYNQFLSKQVDTTLLGKISAKSAEIEKKFSTFRADLGNGEKISDNQIEEILKKETNSEKLKAAWMAHKEIGNVVVKDVIEIVKLRNESAKKLGFKNFHEMSIKLSEQDPEELLKFFDELDKLTRQSYIEVKNEIDDSLAAKCKIAKSDLMPWHYQNRYFQEAPKINSFDLDSYFKNTNIEALTKQYYTSVGHPIDEMVAKSDLYEKPGKMQHAYCTDIDRDKNDIRVVCNITPSHKWMETMLHEYGHAVYQKYVGAKLPWVLKQPAHTFATEGIAMLFGRLATSPAWMKENLKLDDATANSISANCKKSMRMQQLVFSRWVQVVYRFEKEMYANPDQDLNKLWWDLVEKYQMMKRPAGRNSPDWATKIHIATYPCYYHSYLLGEVFASQLYCTINEKVLKANPVGDYGWTGNKEVAKFLEEKVYAPALLYYWDDMVLKATGEKLTPKYFAKQFVN